MADTKLAIEFRCPYCDCQQYHIKNNKVFCEGRSSDGEDYCGNEWKQVEAWECFVLVRRFISKLDFGFYQEHVEDIFKKAADED